MLDSKYFQKRKYWFLGLFFIGCIIGFAAFTPLFDEDEGFVAEATRELLKSQQFMYIKVNGEPRYDKPILFFLLQAVSFKTLGFTLLASRLPSIIASLVHILILFRFCFKNDFKPHIVVFMFVGALQFLIINYAGIFEATLLLFLSLSMFNLYVFTKTGLYSSKLWFYIFMGFGFMTKGPLVVVIPLATFLLVELKNKSFSKIWRLFSLPGLVIFAAIVVPWFYLSYQKAGSVVLVDFFMKHNLSRFSQTMESHGGNHFYYFPVLILGLMPFTPLFVDLIKDFRNIWNDPKKFFFAIWFLLVFVLFSFSKTQLPHYIMAGYIPLILLLSEYFEERTYKRVLLCQVIFMVLLLIAPVVACGIREKIPDDYLQMAFVHLHDVFTWHYYVFILICLAFSGLIYLGRINFKYSVFSFTFAVNACLFFYAKLQQTPIKMAADFASKQNYTVKTMNHYMPSFSFYRGQESLISREYKKGEVYLIKKGEIKGYKYDILFEQYGIMLVKIINNS